MERKKVLTDIEYDILDELYFVTPYLELKQQGSFSEDELKENLARLVHKGWVKAYSSIDKELEVKAIDVEVNYKNYFYLATKRGLMIHNMR